MPTFDLNNYFIQAEALADPTATTPSPATFVPFSGKAVAVALFVAGTWTTTGAQVFTVHLEGSATSSTGTVADDTFAVAQTGLLLMLSKPYAAPREGQFIQLASDGLLISAGAVTQLTWVIER